MRRKTILIAAAALAALAARPSAAQTSTPGGFAVPPPRESVRPAESWGLTATVGGRTRDLEDGSGWMLDPTARSGELAAGLAWRSETSTVVFGYRQPGWESQPRSSPWSVGDWLAQRQDGDRAVLGFSFVFRSP